MDFFRPQFAGTVKIGSPGAEFLDRFERRVQAGLLTGKRDWRARYVVTRHSDYEFAFRACSFMTTINIGLNEVNLRILEDQRLEYVVTYRRWATYAVVIGAACGTAIIACFLMMPGLRGDIAEHDGGLYVFWGAVVFWGFLWPWVLIPLQKRIARRGLIHIINEVDTQGERVSC